MVRLAPAASSGLGDALPADDRAFAVTPPRRRLSVLLVSAGNTFLEAALSLRENLDLTRVAPEAWDGTTRPDVVVLDGVARHPAHEGPALRIAPPELAATRVASDVRIREPRLAPSPSGGPGHRHRLVRHLGTSDWGVEAMPVFSPQKTDLIYLASEAGEPVLWERSPDDPAQRELILSFDLKRSLLPVSVAFPVLMVEALNHLADEPDGILLPLPTGHPDGLTLPASAAGQPVTVTGPGGETAVITARAETAGAAASSDGASVSVDLSESGLFSATFTPAPTPGVAPSAGVAAPDPAAPAAPAAPRTFVFAVNPGDPAESALSPRTDRWQPSRDPTSDGSAPARGAPAEASPATPIWRWLLLGALALVTLEQLLLARRWLA